MDITNNGGTTTIKVTEANYLKRVKYKDKSIKPEVKLVNGYVTSVSVSRICVSCSLYQNTETDLQLAAELGKTLLERNKEGENRMKIQQEIISDQEHHIEYLTKQIESLKEVNESQLMLYDQLEISTSKLETNNQRLIEESRTDKDRIKSLSYTCDLLVSRCEQLQREAQNQDEEERQDEYEERKKIGIYDNRIDFDYKANIDEDYSLVQTEQVVEEEDVEKCMDESGYFSTCCIGCQDDTNIQNYQGEINQLNQQLELLMEEAKITKVIISDMKEQLNSLEEENCKSRESNKLSQKAKHPVMKDAFLESRHDGFKLSNRLSWLDWALVMSITTTFFVGLIRATLFNVIDS